MKFRIKQNSKYFTLIRDDGVYNHHSHYQKESTCKLVIDLIHKGKLPRSKYLRESVKRLLTEEEYEQMSDKKKPKYYNKGGRYQR